MAMTMMTQLAIEISNRECMEEKNVNSEFELAIVERRTWVMAFSLSRSYKSVNAWWPMIMLHLLSAIHIQWKLFIFNCNILISDLIIFICMVVNIIRSFINPHVRIYNSNENVSFRFIHCAFPKINVTFTICVFCSVLFLERLFHYFFAELRMPGMNDKWVNSFHNVCRI